jgi:hypothetical protein
VTSSNRKQMFSSSVPVPYTDRDPKSAITAPEQHALAYMTAFGEFYEKITEPSVKIPFNIVNLLALRHVAFISLGEVDSVIEQVKLLGSFLRNKNLNGMTLAWLACGLDPMTPVPAGDEERRMRTLSGEYVRISSQQVRDAAWVLRQWRFAEENVGFVDFVDFFVWCDERDIDTNYLRLMRELTGCGATLQIGALPLKSLIKYGRQF